MAHGAEAHKKSSKEMCDAHYILQSLQKLPSGLKALRILNVNWELTL